MKFPLSWLKEYIPLSLSAEKISHLLTSLGMEVEGMEGGEAHFEGVVVGKVLSTAPHPNAEKLILAEVTDGKETFSLVCGAKNCRPGIKVAFAKIGAVLQDSDGKSFTIKKAKIRGIESEGMLCASDELGLSQKKAEGILELPEEWELGTDVKAKFQDVIYEISLTPNLSHCLNLLGIARELSAATGIPVKMPVSSLEEGTHSTSFRAEVLEKELCPRFFCKAMTNVQVGPSPDWLKSKIEASGLRSVNNVVDITLFVMLEMGNPLHAYDLDTLKGQRLIVRKAKNNESIVTLDGKQRFLTEEMLVIADADSPVAVAGVMGSASSEVTEKTENILIEAAYFEPTQVRRTSKRLNIHTEASARFERGVDPSQLKKVLERAVSLIQQIAGGKPARDIVELSFQNFTPLTLSCRVPRINQLLGTQLGVGEVESFLKRLDFKILSSKEGLIHVQVPLYRHDVKNETDLVEEVARLYGYDPIYASTHVAFYQSSNIPHHPLYLAEKKARCRLARGGLQELLTCSLISPLEASLVSKDVFPKRSLVHLVNPSSEDQSILRPSLLPGLLKVLKHNFAHEDRSLAGFEVGKIYFKAKDHYLEPMVAAIVLTGLRHPDYWPQEEEEVDFFDLKGRVENFLGRFSLDPIEFIPSSYENFHPQRRAKMLIGGKEIGILGEVHPTTLMKADVGQAVFFAEMDLEEIAILEKKEEKMKPLSLYPSSSRDWTVTLSAETLIQDVLNLIHKQRATFLEKVWLIDIYESDKLGKNWKNVTFRFVYRDVNQTISFKEAEAEHEKLTRTILEQLKAEHKVA